MESDRRIPRDLAHELRTPLAAVITSLDLITSGEIHLEPSEVTEIVQAAKADAEQLLLIIESARGGQAPSPAGGEPVAVGEVVRRVLVRFPAVKARTHLRVDPSVTAVVDPAGLDQILTNLVQNLSRYAPDGQVEVRVRLEGDLAVLEVADEGPGVADASGIFRERPGGSEQGMHLGLSVSRRIARDAGGDLAVADPIRSGATFRLVLPAGERALDATPRVAALAPRARVLVELSDALAERSLPRVEAGISRIAHDLLGTPGVAILVRRGEGFERPGGRGSPTVPADHPLLVGLAGVREVGCGGPEWVEELTGARRALLVPLESGSRSPAVLVLGLPDDVEVSPGDEVVGALGTVAELAVARATLGEEIQVERGLRSSVLEALPIAISIFAGDPPRIVDQNRAERELLGLAADSERPASLGETQSRFDVRFADGTPLTLENSPVMEVMRSGERRGPFHLRVRRLDGTEILSRTHCAPFFDGEGRVAGAVVTSERIEPADP